MLTTIIQVFDQHRCTNEFRTNKSRIRIGSNGAADLRLDDVAPVVAQLNLRQGRWSITNRSAEQITVAEEVLEIKELIDWLPGEDVGIGARYRLRLRQEHQASQHTDSVGEPTPQHAFGSLFKTQCSIVSIGFLLTVIVSMVGSSSQKTSPAAYHFTNVVRQLGEDADSSEDRYLISQLQAARAFELRGDTDAAIDRYVYVRDQANATDLSCPLELREALQEYVKWRLRLLMES